MASSTTKRRRPTTRRSIVEVEDPTPAALTIGTGTGEPTLDPALELFLRRPPTAADHLVITATAFEGEVVMADVTASEVRAQSAELVANQVSAASRRWAENERREVRFRATWQASDRVLGSYGWRAGDQGHGGPPLDGSPESSLAQNQRHLESMMRLHLESEAGRQRGWDKLQQTLERRVQALEALANDMSDRLRRAGDLDAEIQTQQVAADIERRARTQEILEARVLPMLMQMVQTPPPAAAPADAAAPAAPTPPPSAAATGNGRLS